MTNRPLAPAPPCPTVLWCRDLRLLCHAIDMAEALIPKFTAGDLARRAGISEFRDMTPWIQRLVLRGWLRQIPGDAQHIPRLVVTPAGFDAAGRRPIWLADAS